MASLSQFKQFFYFLYVMTIFCVTGLLAELVNGVCSTFETLSASIRRHIATARFLKLIDEENPASRYKIGKRGKPVECAVCISKLEKGEKIRNLKCNHTFHKVCVDTWLQQDSAVTCPVCRSAVLPEEIMVKLRPQRNDNQVYDRSDREDIVSLLLSAIDEVEEGALFSERGQIGVGGRIVKEEKAKLVKSLSPSVI
ncbi:hypothetical protein RHGRI_029937 [Rhododendron griersonianum]|uniref:RING-type domain-containing protein n=1 Tax=Rhododendron griersonianum TaxID=479676 RepID=A0AAV6INS5_9ERIC|nr:hypothetical protein RHGRI_029937 [Rhododendron griersonianum]